MSHAPDVYVITYDHPHRKTQDLLFRLKLAGYAVAVRGLDWEPRKNHRPLFSTGLPAALDCAPEQFCHKLGFDYRWIGNLDAHSRWKAESPVLIGGAPLLPTEFVENNLVLNVHPGWLPKVRGLDSLKWAIYYGYPIGVTVHRVDRQVDLGKLLLQEEVLLLPTDSLQSIALRQYELGLNLMVKALDPMVLGSPSDYAEPPASPTRRMKHVDELTMMERLRQRLAGLQIKTDCRAYSQL